MLNGYKFHLYPDAKQQQIFLRRIGCQRLIYHARVQEDRYFRRFQRRMMETVGKDIPLAPQYSQFIADKTVFLKQVPPQVLRNRAVKYRQTYQQFLQKLGKRLKRTKKSGRPAVWITQELFEFLPQIDGQVGKIGSYQLILGTNKCPVEVISYVAHRTHAMLASIHIAVEGRLWRLWFGAEDPDVTTHVRDADAAAEDLRHRSPGQLAERTLGENLAVAKPLAATDGQIFDLLPVQMQRIRTTRDQRKEWARNQREAYRQASRYPQYEIHTRQERAHHNSYATVANAECDRYAFEGLPINNMAKRPKAKKVAPGYFLPNGAKSKAGPNRAFLSSAWGQVVSFARYKALRLSTLAIIGPFATRSQEWAVCAITSPDNRLTPAGVVWQRCGHLDNANHNAAVVTAKRGIKNLLSGDALITFPGISQMFQKIWPRRPTSTRQGWVGTAFIYPGNPTGKLDPAELFDALLARARGSGPIVAHVLGFGDIVFSGAQAGPCWPDPGGKTGVWNSPRSPSLTTWPDFVWALPPEMKKSSAI